MLESIKFPSLLCFSFQIGDILVTCHMARLCSKGAIGADWLLVLKQVVIWSSGAIVGSHVLSITSFDQDYNFLKAMCIYIPIRRLNNISVDYIFHYKYVNSTFAYFFWGKRACQGARKVLVDYIPSPLPGLSKVRWYVSNPRNIPRLEASDTIGSTIDNNSPGTNITYFITDLVASSMSDDPCGV